MKRIGIRSAAFSAALTLVACGGESSRTVSSAGQPNAGSAGTNAGSVGAGGTGDGGSAGHPNAGNAGVGGTGDSGGAATAGQGATAGTAGQNSTGGVGAAGGQAGAGGTGACTSTPACGGDLVGTWTVMSSCLEVRRELNLSGFGLGCLYAPITGFLSVTGTFTADADGTFSDQTHTSGAQQIEFPETCFQVGFFTCDDMASVVLVNSGYTSGMCVPHDGGCLCDAMVDQTSGMSLASLEPASFGTYESAGNTLMLLNSGSMIGEYEYCVSGSELSLRPLTDTRGTMRGSVVFTK